MTFPIAHRGLAHLHRENSLEAIAAALEHTHVIEVDVRGTQDGVPVCIHDPSLLRTHAVDARVGQLEHARLRELAPDVPTLVEVLDLIHARGGSAMLDVKVTRPRVIAAVEAAVAASGMVWNDGKQLRRGEPIDPGSTVFQSADAQLLRAFRSRTGAGCLELVHGTSSARELMLTAPFITAYAQGVTIPDKVATRPVLRLLQTLRLGTYVYTVNEAARYEALARLRVSAVFADVIDEFAAERASERAVERPTEP
ncbi:MAG: glycerophosphodiester phosphodiesterase [Thermoleophilia bacterium]|nr:glycerophosphodiester phosphodiesterase [Thermoleophilia bacterium]